MSALRKTGRALEVKFAPCSLSDVDGDGRFEGYASVFGKTDLGKDVVLPGAFQDSLKRRGAHGIKMLFQHNSDEPIGLWHEVREDNLGLFVRGQIMSEVVRGREVLSLMRAGVLDGLSIGFRTVDGRRDPSSGIRRLKKIDLWEISVVTFPLLPEARVSHVKRAGDMPTEREFERWLTRDAGFTRSDARMVIRSGFKSLMRRPGAARKRAAMLVQSMRRGAAFIRNETIRVE